MSLPKPRIGIIAPSPPPLGGMAIQAQKLAENLKKEGFAIEVIPTNIPLPGMLRVFENVPLGRTIARSFCLLREVCRRSDRIDVFYMLTGFFDFFMWVTLPVLLLLRILKKRVILSAHGGAAGKFFKKWRTLVKPVLRIPEQITVPSGFLAAEFMENLGMCTAIIPNIIDLGEFHFRRRNRFKPRLIATRHLRQIYDIPCLIKAFHILRNLHPESFLTIAGDGPMRRHIEELVNSLGLGESVRLMGAVPHHQLPCLYGSHDFFVNASRIDNLPVSILEAFASGLPVVSTRAGGIPYLVDNHKTGVLVEIGDSEALAREVFALVSAPEKARQLAENARDLVNNYSWERVRETIIPILTSGSRGCQSRQRREGLG